MLNNADPKYQDFERLKQAVFLKRPVLGEIMKANGQKSVFEYVKSYVARKYQPLNLDRQAELIEVVKEETATKLGDRVAESVGAQLKDYYYVSTTDHYGPMYHPWVFNFNLITSAVYLEESARNLKNVINLACSNVSLNNFAFPRGFAFHSDMTGENKLNRFSLLPSNAHSNAVYGFRAYTADEVVKVKKLLHEAVQKKQIRPEEEQKAVTLVEEIFADKDNLKCTNYADQITYANSTIWKKVLPNTRKKINFVYLEQEVIVARLLIEKHLYEKTTISRIIFDQKSEELLIKYFAGLPEMFSRRDKLGTYLFWAQPKAGKAGNRLRLWKDGNFLVSEDGSYKVELAPEALERALKSKELIPSVLLTFMVLCFYYGLKCFGGLGQINYLPLLKEAYVKMQKDLGRFESAGACATTETDNLGGEVTVALASSKVNGTAPATSFDFMIYGNEKTWPTFVEQSKILTLEEAILPMFSEDYPMLYPITERDPILASITAKDITSIMGLDKKIQSCVNM